MNNRHKILFDPIKIGSLEIKNRFVLAPMGPGGMCNADGSFNKRGMDFYVERAKGGTGLLMTGVTMVENDIEKCALPSMPCPTLNPLNFITTANEMNERIHAYGAKIFLQLSSGFGRVSIPSIVGKTAVAPSEIPHRFLKGVTCRALTTEEVKTYVQKFVESAVIAKKGGFDGVEIHAVHEGYLLDQFAISFFNQRTDEYGGSLENRLRFACEIVQGIKAACGEDFPVSLRYSIKSFIKDWCKGGLPNEVFEEVGRDIPEGIEAAKMLVAAGYDALNADVGSYDSWYWSHPPMYQEKGLYLPYNEILKGVVDVPIISAGRMENPDLASDAIIEGKTDMIGLARPLLADAAIPNKIKAGAFDSVRPCLSCQEGCMGRLQTFATVSCAVNPACARENDYGIGKAEAAKHILIVGGGVAGCEAARVAAIRGHKVTLLEKDAQLGGNLLPGGVPEFKEDDHALVKWYVRELEALNVDVRCQTEATIETIRDFEAETVIVATGSTPKQLTVDGFKRVYSAEDVLLQKKDAGDSVVIIGGGLVGCETALWLKEQGKEVTIVEMQPDILSVGGPLCHANHDMLHDLIAFNAINVKCSASVIRGEADSIVVQTASHQEESIKADSVIIAIGYNSENTLAQALAFESMDVNVIGDANKVKNIMYAIWDAYEVARNL
ncbi:FAD-dependent oxidoreductase [Fusibacter paucivorans]|uniref:FAD-dependent oxidoreductase n=1 Tax=Fusibacter paucivorans TaxID=76009 RepID=A0ABS5PJJ1_9FIRM|nr:FAD-dependent oxidoreductase [Fusibacter paucivorans]MBS7525239.1 FAD-dependent oxidoreductase [Fusibacter paucivorans]